MNKFGIGMRGLMMALIALMYWPAAADSVFQSAPYTRLDAGESMDAGKLNEVLPEGKSEFGGLRSFRAVMPGVLFRGGGSGGKRPLSSTQLKALCEAGFSGAMYLYPDGYRGDTPENCTDVNGRSNDVKYKVHGFRKRDQRRAALKEIHDVIMDRAKGPIFVHCWNGWHASGEIAALALMQFCDWSGREAGEYWKRNIGDHGNVSKYGKIIRQHIGEFEPFSDLRIDAGLQNQVCPSKP